MACILVVDDSEDTRLALSMILKDAGYEVFEASDGSEVFNCVLSDRPDVVLLDIIMPKVDGFQALRKLRADERTRGVPVIMVTAKGRPEDLLMAQSLGALDYINKPWADGEVELRIGWVLRAASRNSR